MGAAIRGVPFCSRCAEVRPSRDPTPPTSAMPALRYLTAIVARPLALSRRQALLAPPVGTGRKRFEQAWRTRLEILEILELRPRAPQAARVRALRGPSRRPPPLLASTNVGPSATVVAGRQSVMASEARCADGTTLCGLDNILAAALLRPAM
jgi:hypothetical protein